MNANEVIESWVRDVAGRLPRTMRNDVACELRALLDEGLAAKAAAAGSAPDRAMAMALLAEFGRPADVARRYHERPAVIDTADTHHFLIWSLVGAVVIGLDAALSPNEVADTDGAFLGWLGMLVIVLGIVGWWRRRTVGTFRWRPTRDPDAMPRWVAAICALMTLVFPVFMYVAPQTFVETMFFGVIPTEGLELTAAFEHSWQKLAMSGVLLAMVAVYLGVFFQGGWRKWSRMLLLVLHVALGIGLLAHAGTMLSPQGGAFRVFAWDSTTANAGPLFTTVGGLMLLCALYQAYQEWARIDPAPAGVPRRMVQPGMH